MAADQVKFGEAPPDGAGRDAVHVAVYPAVAACRLQPGEPVQRTESGRFEPADDGDVCLGIVDPYLTRPVSKGGRFWLCLYPNTVTSLRHEWSHPAFPAMTEPPPSPQPAPAKTVTPGPEEEEDWNLDSGCHCPT